MSGPARLPSPDASWRSRAACRGIDPDLFVPERGESTAEAVAACVGCPVRLDCLAHALTFEGRTAGVWGGFPARPRRLLLAALGGAEARPEAGWSVADAARAERLAGLVLPGPPGESIEAAGERIFAGLRGTAS